MARARTTVSEEELSVVVLRSGGRPVRVNIAEGSTVEDAIEQAGYTVKDRDNVSVNGDSMDRDELADTELEDGDRIVISANFEGGR